MSRDTLFRLYSNEITNNLGNLRINAALLASKTDNQYMISIPFEKNKNVTGMLYYIADGDHDHFALVSYNKAREIVNTDLDSLESIENFLVIALHDMNFYQYTRLHKFDLEVNEFLNTYYSTFNGELSPRFITIEKVWHNYVGTQDEPYAYYQGADIVYYFIPCDRIEFERPSGYPYIPPGSGPIWFDFNGPTSGSVGDGGNTEILISKINTLFNLDPDCEDFVLSQDVLNFPVENYNSFASSCSDETPEEFLARIIDELCYETNPLTLDLITQGSEGDSSFESTDSKIITFDDLENILENTPKIDASFLNDCDLLKCIFDRIAETGNGASENLFCDIFSSFQNDNEISLIFKIDIKAENGVLAIKDNEGNFLKYPSIGLENSAKTLNSSNGSSKTIILHPDFCSGIDGKFFPIYAAAVMLHEMIHAEMYSWISEEYPDLWDWSLPSNHLDNEEYWNNVININLPDYVGNTNQHNVMQVLIDDITLALWELNGRAGKKEHYLYWAHLTLNSAKFGLITPAELLDMKNIFESNVLTPYNDKNNFGC